MNPFGPSILSLYQGLFLGFTIFDHMWYVPTDTGRTELFLATKLEQPDPLTIIATIGDATFHEQGAREWARCEGVRHRRQLQALREAASYRVRLPA